MLLALCVSVVCIFKLSKYLYAFWQVQIYAKNVDEDTGKHKQSAEFKWSINCSWHFSWVEVIKHSNGRRWQAYHDKVVQFSVNFPPFPDCRRHSRQFLIEFWVPPIDLKPHGRGWWASYGWGAATKQFFGSEPLDRAQFKDFIFLVWIIAIERGKIEKIEIDLHCARCALEHSHKWLCKKLELLLFWLSVQVQARKKFLCCINRKIRLKDKLFFFILPIVNFPQISDIPSAGTSPFRRVGINNSCFNLLIDPWKRNGLGKFPVLHFRRSF